MTIYELNELIWEIESTGKNRDLLPFYYNKRKELVAVLKCKLVKILSVML